MIPYNHITRHIMSTLSFKIVTHEITNPQECYDCNIITDAYTIVKDKTHTQYVICNECVSHHYKEVLECVCCQQVVNNANIVLLDHTQEHVAVCDNCYVKV